MAWPVAPWMTLFLCEQVWPTPWRPLARLAPATFRSCSDARKLCESLASTTSSACGVFNGDAKGVLEFFQKEYISRSDQGVVFSPEVR